MIKIKIYSNRLAAHKQDSKIDYYIPCYQLENAHIQRTDFGCTIISYDPQWAINSPMKPEDILNKITPKKLGYETRKNSIKKDV